MEQCANTWALNKHLSGEEQFEKVCEDFEYDVRQVIQEIRSMTRNYQNEYDISTSILKSVDTKTAVVYNSNSYNLNYYGVF